jgi:hypothetical protein
MFKTVRGDSNKLLMDILCLKLWEELLTLTTGGYLMQMYPPVVYVNSSSHSFKQGIHQ